MKKQVTWSMITYHIFQKFYKRPENLSAKTKILSLSWRDIRSPTAGGAEVHTHQLLSYLNRNRFEVTHFSALYFGQPESEVIDGIHYIRKGNVFSVILYAFFYYQKNKKDIDIVIGQCNTHQFFTPLWIHHSKRVFFIHQLTREIWDINAKFPVNKIGKRLENILLKINKKDPVITVSKSTKNELVKLGFEKDKIDIMYNGILFDPWTYDQMYEKEIVPTFIYVGRYSRYKGIDAAAEAVGRLHASGIKAKLWILGKKDQKYVDHELKPICHRYGLIWGEDGKADLVSWGFVSEEKKLELLSRATALVFPSIREGWGIPVTEAGAVGTPSIVYDSPGLRDAVNYGRAGFLCKTNDTEGLYNEMLRAVQSSDEYIKKRTEAYQFSSKFQYSKTGERFEKFINRILYEDKRGRKNEGRDAMNCEKKDKKIIYEEGKDNEKNICCN